MLSALSKASNRTHTENGALSNRSTGSDCLNFFAVCGALRHEDESTQLRFFIRAYAENRDLALRTLFYARDIRGGLGERALFRHLLAWLADHRPRSVLKNIPLMAEYGRWDDLLILLGTPCEAAAVQVIRDQLTQDLAAADSGGPVSLLAKWLPSVNTSASLPRQQARRLCKLLRMTEKEYRRTLSRLRARLDILETRLCRMDYTFSYEKQPSGAMLKYPGAFLRHDHDRYWEYLHNVFAGKATLHAGTLYPYQIVTQCLRHSAMSRDEDVMRSLDAAWKSLPCYGTGQNALAVIDGSGSMYWEGHPQPAAVALSLGIYFAEHNTGYFRDCFITFSHTPQLVTIKGDCIADRVLYCRSFDECANTNLRATFLLLLETAVRHRLPQEELPETLYIISDMEFDTGVEQDKTLYEEVRDLYEQHGYRLPALVYWNVNCRTGQFPVRMDDHGTVLVSGASPAVFNMMISRETTPEAYMLSTLNSPRYAGIFA